MSRHDLNTAQTDFETVVKLSPAARQGYSALGTVLLNRERTQEGIHALETALAISARIRHADEPGLGLPAGWLAGQGAAVVRLARAGRPTAKRPLPAQLLPTYARALPEVVAALREAIRHLPEQPDPHLNLAALLVKQNQLAEAAVERKTAAGLMSANMNRQRAEIATNADDAALKSGDLAGAAAQFHDALSYDANYPEAPWDWPRSWIAKARLWTRRPSAKRLAWFCKRKAHTR